MIPLGGPPTVVRMIREKREREEGGLVSLPENKEEKRSNGMKGLSAMFFMVAAVAAVAVGFVWSWVLVIQNWNNPQPIWWANCIPLFVGLGIFAAIGLAASGLAHSRYNR